MKKKLTDYQILKNQKDEAWNYMNSVLKEIESGKVNKERIIQAINMVMKADWKIISSSLPNKDELINYPD